MFIEHGFFSFTTFGFLMKKVFFIILVSFSCILFSTKVEAQCSICTKTAAQLGEKPAKGLNAGIVYLALTPFAIFGVIAYRWWKKDAA
jgi:hypothetical protein